MKVRAKALKAITTTAFAVDAEERWYHEDGRLHYTCGCGEDILIGKGRDSKYREPVNPVVVCRCGTALECSAIPERYVTDDCYKCGGKLSSYADDLAVVCSNCGNMETVDWLKSRLKSRKARIEQQQAQAKINETRDDSLSALAQAIAEANSKGGVAPRELITGEFETVGDPTPIHLGISKPIVKPNGAFGCSCGGSLGSGPGLTYTCTKCGCRFSRRDVEAVALREEKKRPHPVTKNGMSFCSCGGGLVYEPSLNICVCKQCNAKFTTKEVGMAPRPGATEPKHPLGVPKSITDILSDEREVKIRSTVAPDMAITRDMLEEEKRRLKEETPKRVKELKAKFELTFDEAANERLKRKARELKEKLIASGAIRASTPINIEINGKMVDTISAEDIERERRRLTPDKIEELRNNKDLVIRDEPDSEARDLLDALIAADLRKRDADRNKTDT